MEEFKCNLCGKTFKNSSGLGGHKAALHGIKKAPQPKLKDLLRDGLAELQHHIAGLEGRVVALERARLQAPLSFNRQPDAALEGRVAALERARLGVDKVAVPVDPGLAALARPTEDKKVGLDLVGLAKPIPKKKELWDKP